MTSRALTSPFNRGNNSTVKQLNPFRAWLWNLIIKILVHRYFIKFEPNWLIIDSNPTIRKYSVAFPFRPRSSRQYSFRLLSEITEIFEVGQQSVGYSVCSSPRYFAKWIFKKYFGKPTEEAQEAERCRFAFLSLLLSPPFLKLLVVSKEKNKKKRERERKKRKNPGSRPVKGA